MDTDPADLVQNKFLKWLLDASKHCSNDACKAETGKFPLRIEAESKNFKFWLTLVRPEENNCHKLPKEVYKDKDQDQIR